MWIRLPIAAVTALASMGILFGVLFGLVQTHFDMAHRFQTQRIEFTRLKRDTDVKTTRNEKPDRPPTAAAPTAPRISVGSFDSTAPPMKIDTAGVGGKIQLSKMGISMGGSDRDVIPLVRIQPQYPTRAAARGIEGWVRVQFTITPAGAVKDASVTDSEPRGMFDRAALDAVSRWKYNPKVEGGVAVERRGVQVLLTFQLEK